MSRFGLLVLALLLVAPPALAGSASWSLISFSASPLDAPALVKATDKLMSSEAGMKFPGQLLLLVNIADGDNPATHSFVPIYSSAAERERFVAALQADKSWRGFMKTLTKKTEPVANTLYRTLMSWGDKDEADSVWMTHAFQVRDPAAFADAIQRFMRTRTGRSFPGQVYLSAVVAGGGPASHVISVGYASEAEMAEWLEKRDGSTAWGAYMRRSRKAADYLGGSLAREVKTWGDATLAELTAD